MVVRCDRVMGPERMPLEEEPAPVNERWVTLSCLLSLPLARSEASDPQDEPAPIRATEEEKKRREPGEP